MIFWFLHILLIGWVFFHCYKCIALKQRKYWVTIGHYLKISMMSLGDKVLSRYMPIMLTISLLLSDLICHGHWSIGSVVYRLVQIRNGLFHSSLWYVIILACYILLVNYCVSGITVCTVLWKLCGFFYVFCFLNYSSDC